jgi:hypothetical protein
MVVTTELMTKAIGIYKTDEEELKNANDWNRFHFHGRHHHNSMKKERYERRINALKHIDITNLDNFIQTAKKHLDNSDELIKIINSLS